MRALTIDESFSRYLAEPSADLLLPLRQQILTQADYRPYAPIWQQIDQWLSNGNYDEVLREAGELEGWALLSPRWHYWMGVAAAEAGDFAEAGYRRNAVQACLRGLLATGEGTEDAPFLVTYSTDAYDVMQAIGGNVSQQALVETSAGRFCDRLTAEDGEEYWFDVTDMLAHANKGRSGREWQDQTIEPQVARRR